MGSLETGLALKRDNLFRSSSSIGRIERSQFAHRPILRVGIVLVLMIFCNITVKICKFTMILCNIAVKVYKFTGFFFFLLKLLGSVDEVDEVAVGFFWVLVWFQLSRK